MKPENFIKKVKEIGIADVGVVGGKNSSLGEMFTQLSNRGIRVPDGFATTAPAFTYFLEYNNLDKPLQGLMQQLDHKNYSNLREIGLKTRQLLLSAKMPDEFSREIVKAYKELCGETYFEVAVRSSATAEDLPQASFAGQHESYR